MLRGEKVALRSLEREDLKRLHELARNVDLMLLADGSWEPEPLAAYEKEFDEHVKDPMKGDFVIEVDGLVIGNVHLHRDLDRRAGTAALGISILDPEYLGKGYGRDAVATFLRWAFLIQNFHRIYLDTLASNERAMRCYRACGFREEGRLRQHEYVNGAYTDVVLMGLLREEWLARDTTTAPAPA